MIDGGKLLTAAQVGRRLNIRPGHVLRLIRRRDLAAVQIGRQWRIEPQAIEAYITAHRQATNLEEAAPVDDRQLALFTPPLQDLQTTLAGVDALRLTMDRLRERDAVAIDPDAGADVAEDQAS